MNYLKNIIKKNKSIIITGFIITSILYGYSYYNKVKEENIKIDKQISITSEQYLKELGNLVLSNSKFNEYEIEKVKINWDKSQDNYYFLDISYINLNTLKKYKRKDINLKFFEDSYIVHFLLNKEYEVFLEDTKSDKINVIIRKL